VPGGSCPAGYHYARAPHESAPSSATSVTETLASRSGTLGEGRCRWGWLLAVSRLVELIRAIVSAVVCDFSRWRIHDESTFAECEPLIFIGRLLSNFRRFA
jgi:hypothetical protein